jgi:phosphate transport system substrate-binding protein
MARFTVTHCSSVVIAWALSGAVACGASDERSHDDTEVSEEHIGEIGTVEIGTVEQPLTGPDGTGFFGSDTLFNVITGSITAWDALQTGLTYLGTGSGNGQACLRGTATGVAFGGSVFCNGAPGQAYAPMSRDLNGTCAPGDRSRRVALDGIGAWKASNTQPAVTNVSVASLKAVFCGDGAGGSCTGTNWSSLGGSAAALDLYRRDDTSGTTDSFKTLVGCTAFCANIQVVNETVDGPRINGVQPPECLGDDSATRCIGKIVASRPNSLAYSGRDAANVSPAPVALTVNGIALTDDNIRGLNNGAATPYPLARFLFLNFNQARFDALPDISNEKRFGSWTLGVAPDGDETTLALFEEQFIAQDFVSCDPAQPMNCDQTGVACP